VLKDRGSDAVEALERFREHLVANGVDFAREKLTVGPWLEMDADRDEFVGRSAEVAWANRLLRREYREPFVVV
jgi:hypothetical protein